MMLLKTYVMGEHIPFQPCAGMNMEVGDWYVVYALPLEDECILSLS